MQQMHTATATGSQDRVISPIIISTAAQLSQSHGRQPTMQRWVVMLSSSWDPHGLLDKGAMPPNAAHKFSEGI